MLWPFSNFYGWWNRQPVDVSREAAPAPAPADGTAQTSLQTQPFGLASSTIGADYCDPTAPSGGYATWRAMDFDPALVLNRGVVTAPIREAETSFEAREGTPDDWAKAVQDAITPLWPALISEAFDSLSMGWKPFEVPWARQAGLTVPVDFRPLAQELTTWLHRGGVFAGLRNQSTGEKVDLAPENSLVITCGGHNRDPYGIPWHENARETWWRKIRCIRDLAKLRKKGSGIQGKIWYPPADDEGTAHTNENAARKVLNAYMDGSGAVLPNATGGLTADTAADYRNIQGLAEAGLWKLEIENFGSIGADHAAVLAEIAACNADLSRAWYVPERAAQEGQHGTKAEAEAHGDIALTMSQLVFNDICDAITKQVIDTMLVQNWGEKARGAVTLKAGKLRDVFAADDRRLIDAVLKEPDLFAAVVEQVDLDAVFTRRGIPKNKGVLTLTDAIKEGQKRRDEAKQAKLQQPPVPMNGQTMNGNGNGRLAMARGVEWLGRLIDDHEVAESHEPTLLSVPSGGRINGFTMPAKPTVKRTQVKRDADGRVAETIEIHES